MKSKWLLPIIILILFCIALSLSINMITNTIINLREKDLLSKKNREIELAYDKTVKLEDNISNIKDIQTGETYSVMLKEDGTVWVTGVNSYYDDITKYGIQNNEFTKMRIDDVEKISVGNDFVLALTNNGEVYSWGGNTYGQLGVENARTREVYEVPRKLELKNIVEIYAFGMQAAALSKDSVAYYWGYTTDIYRDTKPKEFNIDKVSEIYLTYHQNYFKTVNNEIYGLGYDFEGVTDQVNGWAREPVKIDISNVKSIVSHCHYDHNDSDDKVKIGSNSKFVLKDDGTISILNTKLGELEKKIEGFSNIVDIYQYQVKKTNSAFSSFIAVDNKGNGFIQREGLGNYYVLNEEIIKIQNIKTINSYEDTIIITKTDNTIWNLGSSIEDMQIREGGYSPSFCYEIEQINVNNVKKVSISKNFMFVIDENNKIYRHGYNNYGQLGIEEEKQIQELELIYTSDKNFHYDKIQEKLNKEKEMNQDNKANKKEPYWVELENGERILIDPNLSN